ncbi:MAG TPA: 50S ribosomal protein L5 [Methanoculleus sp.]|nr:50S ribosomal protein L5 [Methanoculleus sp.]
MRELYVDKVVVHMGVGESGEKLVKAENIMTQVTGQPPVRAFAKRTQPAFGVRKGQPIGCRVTLRGDRAETFVQTALGILENTISATQFDATGNFSFGIEEHTDFPGQSYDPMIGIYGMDVSVVLERKGIRIARRALQEKKLPTKQRVTKDDAVAYVKEAFNVEVL